MKLALSIGLSAACTLSFAQFNDDFEGESASAGGVVLTGQNGWYLPAVTGSLDGNVYNYAGNGLGVATNPNGGGNFAGGMDDGVGQIRMQHAVTFSGGVWTMSFDFLGAFNGTPPSFDNLGSVSLQDSTTANMFQTIYQWGANTGNPTAFSANVGHFASTGQTGSGGGIVFESPGAAWSNLPVNHWFHQTVTWDFTSNLITDTTLQDITAGGPLNDFQPTGWYLAGGANNSQGLANPTDIRLFVGGGGFNVPGNVMGFDNLNVAPVPEPATLAALGMGALALLRRRRKS